VKGGWHTGKDLHHQGAKTANWGEGGVLVTGKKRTTSGGGIECGKVFRERFCRRLRDPYREGDADTRGGE